MLGFDAVSGSPIPAVPYLNGSSLYPGEFAQFLQSSEGVRGVAVVTGSGGPSDGDVWIASEDDDGVYGFSGQTGYPFVFVSIGDPVGVYYDNSTQTVFVSSHTKSNPQVVQIDPSSGSIIASYVNSNEGHPAGMLVYDGVLYVVGQDSGALYSFQVGGDGTATVIVPTLSGTGEQVRTVVHGSSPAQTNSASCELMSCDTVPVVLCGRLCCRSVKRTTFEQKLSQMFMKNRRTARSEGDHFTTAHLISFLSFT